MGRSKVLSAAVCAALLVAAACSPSGDDDGTSAAAGADDTEATTAAAEDDSSDVGAAVPVTMELESTMAATATVGVGGGSVYATGMDGTEYALQIPPGALPRATEITVTPLAGLTGLPSGTRLGFGVDLQPTGLVFAAPSWLFVRSDVEPDDVTGLAIHEDEASLTGIGFDGERFVLSVGHFSGNGSCMPRCGGPAWPDFPGGPRGPGAPGGPPLQPLGNGVPDFQPPGTPIGGLGDLTSGFPGGLDPFGGAPGAATNTGLDAEVSSTVNELGQAQLSGDEEAEARANEKLDKVKEKVKNAAWDAAKVCVDEKDLTKLKDILHWVTIGQLLGAAKDDAEEERLTSLIASCNKFEMETIGDLEFRMGGDVFVIGDSINATIPLPSDGAAYTGEKIAEVEPVGYDRGAEMLELLAFGMGAAMGIDVPNNVSQNDYIRCDVAPKGQGRLTVLATNMFADDGPDVLLALASAREASVNCPDPIGTFPMPPWVMDLPIHIDAGFPGASESGLFFGDGWTLKTKGNPFATKDVHHEVSSEGLVMVMGWHLTINHVPGPLPPRPEGWPPSDTHSTPTSRPSLTDP